MKKNVSQKQNDSYDESKTLQFLSRQYEEESVPEWKLELK